MGTKNAWFGLPWCWHLKAILSNLKSAPSSVSKSAHSNLSNCKILRKNKNAKIWDQNALFGYFWPKMPYLDIFGIEVSKNLFWYLKSAPSNLPNKRSLTHTVNFGIGSTFSKYSRSAFSEGPGQGPGPLYKVCQAGMLQNCAFWIISFRFNLEQSIISSNSQSSWLVMLANCFEENVERFYFLLYCEHM